MLPPILGLIDDIPQLLRRVDAVVFHGGGDIDPRRYGQEATEESLYGIVPEHDAMELAMVTAAIESDKPVLAICRGLQVLNVALGGTLVQDIGSEDHWLRFTANDLDAGSRIAKAMGTEAPERCHCVHHQALDRAGRRAAGGGPARRRHRPRCRARRGALGRRHPVASRRTRPTTTRSSKACSTS